MTALPLTAPTELDGQRLRRAPNSPLANYPSAQCASSNLG